jgi:mRNA interferase MazF
VLEPSRGEIWNGDLDPTRGREQAGKRPLLVISTDGFNHGPAELVVILPITTKDKRIPWHYAVKAGEGGLTRNSFIMCEAVRCVARERLSKRLGSVLESTIEEVELRLRMLLDLP